MSAPLVDLSNPVNRASKNSLVYLGVSGAITLGGAIYTGYASNAANALIGVAITGMGCYLLKDRVKAIWQEFKNGMDQHSFSNHHVAELAAGTLGALVLQNGVMSGSLNTGIVGLGAMAAGYGLFYYFQDSVSWVGFAANSGVINKLSPHHLAHPAEIYEKFKAQQSGKNKDADPKETQIAFRSVEAALFAKLFTSDHVRRHPHEFEGRSIEDIRKLYPGRGPQNWTNCTLSGLAAREYEDPEKNWFRTKRKLRRELRGLLYQKYGIGAEKLSTEQKELRKSLIAIPEGKISYVADRDTFLIGSDDGESLVASKLIESILADCQRLIKEGRTQERAFLEDFKRRAEEDVKNLRPSENLALRRRMPSQPTVKIDDEPGDSENSPLLAPRFKDRPPQKSLPQAEDSRRPQTEEMLVP